jgi:hypothetical protein
MSNWTKFATNFFKQQKKQNPSYTYGEALTDASRPYNQMKKGGKKKGGNEGEKPVIEEPAPEPPAEPAIEPPAGPALGSDDETVPESPAVPVDEKKEDDYQMTGKKGGRKSQKKSNKGGTKKSQNKSKKGGSKKNQNKSKKSKK